jgi:hypothetical protein
MSIPAANSARRSRLGCCFGILAAFVLAAAPRPVLAAPSFWVSASGSSSAYGGSEMNADTGILLGVRDTSVIVETSGTNPHGGVSVAHASAHAALGWLTAACDGSTSDGFYEGWMYLSGNQARFFDLITVVSNTLPVGTPVTLHIHQDVIRALSFAGGVASTRYLSQTGINQMNYGPGTIAQAIFGNYDNSQSDTGPFDYATFVGTTFQFSGNLQVGNQGFWGAQSAASCSTHYHVDVLTPGAFLVSESCTDYGSTPAVRFASEPADQGVSGGGTASFSVTSARLGPYAYQWRRFGVPLADGGRISGATTATLSVNPAQTTDAGNYDVIVSSSCGPDTSRAALLTVDGVTDVASAGAGLFAMSAPSPNPMTGHTTLILTLARASHVRVSIEDVAGRSVRVLLAGDSPAGTQYLPWDGRDTAGRSVAPGMYRCRLVVNGAPMIARGIVVVR